MASGQFSARQIARRAGVNHGQVHHLFEGKDGLHRAVLEHLASGLDAELQGVDGPALANAALTATMADTRFVRFLATYLVEHPDDAIPQESFPVVRRLLDTFAEPEGPSRPQLAAMLAAGLGWALFQRWIQTAMDLTDEESAEVETVITEVQAK